MQAPPMVVESVYTKNYRVRRSSRSALIAHVKNYALSARVLKIAGRKRIASFEVLLN